MKTTNTIRILTVLSFLIFFCPFFDMCSHKDSLKKFKNEEVTIVEKVVETNTVPVQDTVAEQTTITADNSKINPGNKSNEEEKTAVFSGYGMGTYLFKYYEDLEAGDLKDSSFYALLCFTFILIISVLQAILSLKSKLRQVHNLAYVNIFLSLVSMLIFYFNSTLDELNQIKFGYYLFLINTITIIVLCKKAIKQNAI